MKRLILIGMLLSACAPSAPVKPYGSNVLPLDANGLPPQYSLCVRNKAVTSAAIYDVYYGCQEELVFYLAERADLTQPQKAELRIDLEKKAVNYAHETAVAFHGPDAVRKTIDPSFKPDPKTQPAAPRSTYWLDSSESEKKSWVDCVGAQLRSRDISTGSVAPIAIAIAGECKHLFKGRADYDVDVVVNAVEKVRARLAASGPVIIDQKSMAPTDKRF